MWLVFSWVLVSLLLRWLLLSLLRGLLCLRSLMRPLLLVSCLPLVTWPLALLWMWTCPTRLLLSSLLSVGCMRPPGLIGLSRVCLLLWGSLLWLTAGTSALLLSRFLLRRGPLSSRAQ